MDGVRPTTATLRQHDAPQLRMAAKVNAEQIVGLALVPVGRGPHRAHAVDGGRVSGEGCVEAQPPVVAQRVELVNRHETRREPQAQPVDGADEQAKVVGQARLVAQVAADLQDLRCVHGEHGVAVAFVPAVEQGAVVRQHRLWKAFLQLAQFVRVHAYLGFQTWGSGRRRLPVS